MKRTKSKYGKKASEKVARTLHEFKRGKLRSGGGGKVTSREQAIAIGLAQARRAGYKTPPLPRGHAAMNLDARVRAYLSNMQPGAEIDARGIARALGSGDLEADYALERAARAGLAVTSDGRWFGPSQARKTPPAQLKREIAEALAGRTLEDAEPHPRPGGRSSATIKLDSDDARMFGRYALRASHGAVARADAGQRSR